MDETKQDKGSLDLNFFMLILDVSSRIAALEKTLIDSGVIKEDIWMNNLKDVKNTISKELESKLSTNQG